LRGSVSGAVDRGLFSSRRNSVTAVVNQEIVLNSDGAALVEIAAETIPRRLAWRDNMLAFDGETLNEAIAQVSQQTGWQFELADPRSARCASAVTFTPIPKRSSSCFQPASISKPAAKASATSCFRIARNPDVFSDAP
jgi:hypothetical protein